MLEEERDEEEGQRADISYKYQMNRMNQAQEARNLRTQIGYLRNPATVDATHELAVMDRQN